MKKKAMKPTSSVLVLGGGIGGVQSSLELANRGINVFLVEKEPFLGGKVAQLHSIFPSMENPVQVLTPLLLEAAKHPRISILTNSDVEEIVKNTDTFQVKLQQRTRFVDVAKCNSCGDCVAACPVSFGDNLNFGATERKAIHQVCSQSVPNTMAIEKKEVAPCQIACPAGVHAQGYIALIAKGKYQEALDLERAHNPLPAICGRVCNHPCEINCRRAEVDQPIAICSLKRFAADWEMEHFVPFPKKVRQTHPEKVAIVGSGPGGLSAAYYLAKMGYGVTIFESLPVPGGMLTGCIPSNRLPRDVINYEIDYIKALGVQLKTGVTVGKDISFAELRRQGFKAFFLAVGAWKGLKLKIEGEDDFEGFLDCITFLKEVNLGKPQKPGERVLVIGGGNAAIDAARTAHRLGCKDVNIVYRRSRKEMPANEWEIDEAEHEGVKIHYLTSPIRIMGKDGMVTGMQCLRNKLGPPDSSGRRRPVPIKGSEFVVRADVIIPAISQEPDLDFLPKKHGFKISKWNSFEINEDTLQTNQKGVFAGGDCVTGPSTVIEAVAAGQRAAVMIDKYLQKQPLTLNEPSIRKAGPLSPKEVKAIGKDPRAKMPVLSLKERHQNFREVELGFDEKSALKEAERCLTCGICSECLQCETVCPQNAVDNRMEDTSLELTVGAVVLATGSEMKNLDGKGAAAGSNVYSAMEFERLISLSEQDDTFIRRRSDGKIPKKVGFLQLFHDNGNAYSLQAAKMALIASKKSPELACFVFDEKWASSESPAFSNVSSALQAGRVSIVPSKVKVGANSKSNSISVTWKEKAKNKKVQLDMLVVAPPINGSPENLQLAKWFGLKRERSGFLKPSASADEFFKANKSRVFCVGSSKEPMDVDRTRMSARAAAAQVLQLFGKKK